ncbi:putative phosphorylase b kinase regulatory subunit alpha [Haemaphysalis longicornis]
MARRLKRFTTDRLDHYEQLLYATVVDYQDPVSGLIPGYRCGGHHAWVRDNVYCVYAMWGLSMAYKKHADLDEDRAKAYELEHRAVKLMRGLLKAMMLQTDKLERFKESQCGTDSLHAKYDVSTGETCVGDNDYGHLQVDATSVFLLVLAQLTAGGVQVIFNLDEVAFVQNLVFYIESAYYVPDFGMWERGEKTNRGIRELNASSVGMAKAAMQALNELDLFGGRGGPASTIHVLADDRQKCDAVLTSMLPRESNSKEVDGALIAVAGFPAFAIDDPELIELTRNTIIEKLQGQYGCKRFLRDGYKTPREDSRRPYYEPWELQAFERIECEWPLFFCFLIIDANFRDDRAMADMYVDMLDKLLVKTDDGLKLVPQMYAVPAGAAVSEYNHPLSQTRVPIGEIPFMWAQSLYIVGRLLEEHFLSPGELDPLNRRLTSLKKPELVVQVALLAEDWTVKEKVSSIYPDIQTIMEAAPIEVYPARVLGDLWSYLGQARKLGLSGRLSRDVGLLATSKIYILQDRPCVFTPQNLDSEEFHLLNDVDLFSSTLRANVAMLRAHWRASGRPTMVVTLQARQLSGDRVPVSLRQTIKKLVSGYVHGTRVSLNHIDELFKTSCVTSLDFLGDYENGYPDRLPKMIRDYLEREMSSTFLRPTREKLAFRLRPSSSGGSTPVERTPRRHRASSADRIAVGRRKSVATGMIRRSRSLARSSPASEETYHDYRLQQTALVSGLSSLVVSRRGSVSGEEEVPFCAISELQFEQVAEFELLTTLRETTMMEEQGDILFYLSINKGLNWDTGLGFPTSVVTVWNLFQDFYERACQEQRWGLVRHFAGPVGKRVGDLAMSVTDLLVRQKQVTVGRPPMHEHVIMRPLPAKELRKIISDAHPGDQSMAMLTQELLTYLAMFIQTDPHLFREVVRLRVGLIIQVMASEVARASRCDAQDAVEVLLNLSPYEMQSLLLATFSGHEIHALDAISAPDSQPESASTSRRKMSVAQVFVLGSVDLDEGEESVPSEHPERGQWVRRRKLDGALNRVPVGFYSRVWGVLERCPGIWIRGKCLPQGLTREMTAGEFKFALRVEEMLNKIPQPEYRQLLVEALMVISLTLENDAVYMFRDPLDVEGIVLRAHGIFLEDQRQYVGNSTLCCCGSPPVRPCNTVVGICEHFYDSAPSGCFGTMTYLVRAVAHMINELPASLIQCAPS